MTTGDPIAKPNSLVERVKAILLSPKTEWPVIASEATGIRELYTGYAMILAAIPPVAGLIGGQIFGYGVFGITFRPPIISAISSAIVGYILSLVMIGVLALIIENLAPTFGGVKDRVAAFKVAIYSYTAGWVAGILTLIPGLSVIAMLASLYGFYLLYVGLPVLMKSLQEKALAYTAATVVVAIVLGIVISLVTAAVTSSFGGGYPGLADAGTAGGTVEVPGMGKIDLDKMNEATARMEASAKKMEQAAATGQSAALAPSALQALLPASIGAFARTEISSSGLGVGGAMAEGKYESGDKSISLEITDMAAAGALAGLAGAMGVESNRQTATGYEKTSTQGGRLVTEEWDNSGDGKYSTTIANRFMVSASGQAGSIDALKAAVASVDLGKLEALAQ